MNLYFISGLGADERVFQKLSLPSEYTINHIRWPELSPNETLLSYCVKISTLIDTSKEFSLIGLSFGGIITTELTKIMSPSRSIIISSISSIKEMPVLYKVCGLTGLNRAVPSIFLNKIYPFTYWFFGVKKVEDKALLKQVIKDTSPKFLKWALNEIVNWKNNSKPANVYHIHGTQDRLFPFKFTKADKQVENGGHLMVYTNANTVSDLIRSHLGSR